MYARATVPTGTISDIRAIAIEEKVGPDATAEEIYDSLEIHGPQTSHEHIFVHKEAPKSPEGEPQRWYGMDPAFYNQLPTFQWSQIFNMTGAPLAVVPALGQKAKKNAERQVDIKKKKLQQRIDNRLGSASSMSTATSTSAGFKAFVAMD